MHFERSEEVCACVAEMIVERRLSAGLRTPPGAVRKIAEALRDGVRFIENEEGIVVPAPRSPAPSAKPEHTPPKPPEKSPPKKRKRSRPRRRNP